MLEELDSSAALEIWERSIAFVALNLYDTVFRQIQATRCRLCTRAIRLSHEHISINSHPKRTVQSGICLIEGVRTLLEKAINLHVTLARASRRRQTRQDFGASSSVAAGFFKLETTSLSHEPHHQRHHLRQQHNGGRD